MYEILLVFGPVQVLMLLATATLGWLVPTIAAPWHLFAGLGSALVTIALQSLIFVYFLGTGKSVRLAVQENGADPALYDETRRFKFDCYPISLLTALSVILTGFLGSGALVAVIPAWVHGLFAVISIGLAVGALRVQLDRVRRNQVLLEDLKQLLKSEIPEPRDLVWVPATPAEERIDRIHRYGFLAALCWLPYIYLRYIVRATWVPATPFWGVTAVSLVLALRELVNPPAPAPRDSPPGSPEERAGTLTSAAPRSG